jgi:two-component system CheB/CheR fusion protein
MKVKIAPQVERRSNSGALRVMVADDEHDTVDGLALILKSEGHVVHTAYTGQEVLSAISGFRPDVVILDIGLPGVSGYAIAQAIRNSFTDIRRPLMIAITGLWMETPDRIVAQQVGFDHFLLKPCKPDEVTQLLARARVPKPDMLVEQPGGHRGDPG